MIKHLKDDAAEVILKNAFHENGDVEGHPLQVLQVYTSWLKAKSYIACES